MTSVISYSVALACHPATPSLAVRGVQVAVSRTPDDILALTYTLTGDCTRLRIPPPCPPCRVDSLWQHTCFEAFIACTGKPAYAEFNFAPSGEWAAYTFRRYREGAPLEEVLAPGITVRSTEESFELDALVYLNRLSHLPHAPLILGLSAVIEEVSGHFSYWALKHPSGKPDFHHTDAFALELMTREQ